MAFQSANVTSSPPGMPSGASIRAVNTIERVIKRLWADIAVSDRGKIRTLSKNFWGDLGVAAREKSAVTLVRAALREAGLEVADEQKFGSERGDDWLVIRSLAPHTPAVTTRAIKPEVKPPQPPKPPRALSLPSVGTMRMLSVRQPWAELIVRGIKDVENRSM